MAYEEDDLIRRKGEADLPLVTWASRPFANRSRRRHPAGVVDPWRALMLAIPDEPGVIVRGGARALEPFDPVEEHELAGEARIVTEQIRTRLARIEVDAQKHRDQTHVERERLADEGGRESTGRAVGRIADDRVNPPRRRGVAQEIVGGGAGAKTVLRERRGERALPDRRLQYIAERMLAQMASDRRDHPGRRWVVVVGAASVAGSALAHSILYI
jgi:hypothetical protein